MNGNAKIAPPPPPPAAAAAAADLFSARCNIYTSRLCYDVTVRLSVCLWRKCIGAEVSNFDPNLPRTAVAVHAGASTELFIVQ